MRRGTIYTQCSGHIIGMCFLQHKYIYYNVFMLSAKAEVWQVSTGQTNLNVRMKLLL